MKAEETVIQSVDKIKCLTELYYPNSKAMARRLNNLLKAQAEISFKAGQEEGKYSISTIVDVGNDAFKDGRKAGYEQSVLDNDEWCRDGIQQGRREVVDKHFWYRELADYIVLRIPKSKLKEWGLTRGV